MHNITDKEIKLARFLCKKARRDPDKLEPGNAPYGDDETEAIDGYLKGDPSHYSWREFVPQAREIIKLLN